MKIRKRWIVLLLVVALSIAAALLVKRYFTQITHGWDDLRGGTDPIPSIMMRPAAVTNTPEDWPSWRGRNQDNTASLTLRTDWRGGLTRLWEVRYLCQGPDTAAWSCPVIQGNHLVVMGRDAQHDLIFCLDPQTGALRWKTMYPAAAKDNYGPGARATPFIDGDRVYTLGRGGELLCLRLSDGNLLWRRDFDHEGGAAPEWGHSSSPLVASNYLYIQGGEKLHAAAFHKTNGEPIWAVSGGPAGYASPVLAPFPLAGRNELVIFHGEGLAGFDEASGSRLWNIDWKTSYGMNITTPVVAGNLVIATSTSGAFAAEVGSNGAAVRWKTRDLCGAHTDPLVIGSNLYGYSGSSLGNRGDFRCLDLATGKLRWKTPVMGGGTAIQVDKYLLCLDHKGNLFLVKPDPASFKLASSFPNAIPRVQEQSWTKPIVAGGNLYLRYRQRLLCYRLAR
ncbi:MAG: PQQ-like beta-propeller repeat protein [Spirochaetes bacterium]|nr:PQQ-like beta-propeller repeat protein [Spirochaetota bacterium]